METTTNLLGRPSKDQILAVFSAAILLFAHTAFGQQTVTSQKDAGLVDSDGDGINDKEDSNPLLAEIHEVSWSIRPLIMGWKWDASSESSLVDLAEAEKSLIKQKSLSFGLDAGVGAELATNAQASASLNPLKLFGLGGTGAGIDFRTRLSASGNVDWDRSSQERASQMRRVMAQSSVAERISGLHLEFTVDFFNQSASDFMGQNLQIPIKTAEGNVATYAQPWGANGPEATIRIPAGRGKAIPIRFRADLDTTQSLSLLETMEASSPTIDFTETQGMIISEVDGHKIDAITRLIQIRKKTGEVLAEVDGRTFVWRVAKKNEVTGEKLTLGDAFEAINDSVPGSSASDTKLFVFTERYLVSALGRDNAVIPRGWWTILADSTVRDNRDVVPSSTFVSKTQLKYLATYPPNMDRWIEIGKVAEGVYQEFAGKNPSNAERGAGHLAFELSIAATAIADEDEKRAYELWNYAHQLGASGATLKLGLCYLGGLGVAKSESKAVELFRKAAEDGDSLAMGVLGASYEVGTGVAKDEAEAIRWYRKSADAGNLDAMISLARCYIHGVGGISNDTEGAYWYRKAAEAGDPRAIYAVGNCYLDGRGVRKDEQEAVKWYRRAAEAGEPSGMYALGACLLDGRGLEKDEKGAVEWYRKAAEAGHATAMHELGRCSINGQGVEKDEAKAIDWYRKAAKAGEPLAALSLGLCYERGLGLEKDDNKATEWYRKAAEAGNLIAAYKLGYALIRGVGVSKNEELGAEWFRKAAESGHPPAMFAVGVCLLNGIGEEKDREAGLKWLRKAAELGDEDADELLQELKEGR